jgi:hypothetical protein
MYLHEFTCIFGAYDNNTCRYIHGWCCHVFACMYMYIQYMQESACITVYIHLCTGPCPGLCPGYVLVCIEYIVSICLHMHVCMCMHVFICICVYAYIIMYTCIFMYCMHMYLLHASVYTCMYVLLVYSCFCMNCMYSTV